MAGPRWNCSFRSFHSSSDALKCASLGSTAASTISNRYYSRMDEFPAKIKKKEIFANYYKMEFRGIYWGLEVKLEI